MTDSLLRH